MISNHANLMLTVKKTNHRFYSNQHRNDFKALLLE